LSAGNYSIPISQSEFIIALALFAGGTFIYAGAREWLAPLLAISTVMTGFAAARAVYWANSPTLRFAQELSYRIVALAAVVAVLRFRRTRREIGPWVLSAGLLLLHLEATGSNLLMPADAGVFFDLTLGLGMLLVVLEESRLHTRRLMAMNALSAGITRARHNGSSAGTLQFVREITGADAVWLRTTDGHRMSVLEQAGLSADFLRDRVTVTPHDKVEGIPESARPMAISRQEFGQSAGPIFQREQLAQVVATAVPGRNAAIGVLLLGTRNEKSYAPDELEFLVTNSGWRSKMFTWSRRYSARTGSGPIHLNPFRTWCCYTTRNSAF
jgi:hypothetical protein